MDKTTVNFYASEKTREKVDDLWKAHGGSKGDFLQEMVDVYATFAFLWKHYCKTDGMDIKEYSFELMKLARKEWLQENAVSAPTPCRQDAHPVAPDMDDGTPSVADNPESFPSPESPAPSERCRDQSAASVAHELCRLRSLPWRMWARGR